MLGIKILANPSTMDIYDIANIFDIIYIHNITLTYNTLGSMNGY